MKTVNNALISGVTHQNGAYLADLLLNKGDEVHGIKRRSSPFNTARICHSFQDMHENEVINYIDDEVYGTLDNANHADEDWLFVGNQPYPIPEVFNALAPRSF